MKLSPLALLPLSLVLLTGCDTVRDTLGLEHSAPNEFDVSSSAPLSMPPDYNLRPPEPGAARPQEVPADVQAQKTLLGSAAPAAKGGATTGSSGENAFLQQVGSAPTAVTSAELPKGKTATPQQERLEKVLFDKPTATADAPQIEMDTRGGWFNWF